MRWPGLLLPLLILGASARAGEPQPPGGGGARPAYEFAVYTVNGRPITRSYLALRTTPQLRRFRQARDERKRTGGWGPREEQRYQQIVVQVRMNAVRGVVFGYILRAEAERFVKAGLKVTERQVADRLRRVLKRSKGPAGIALREGLSVAALKEMIRDDLLAEAYQRNLRVSVARPTPQEIADYYKFHSESFRKPEAVRAKVILIKRFVFDEKLGREIERKTARKRAEEVLAKLKGGADFSKMARRHSEDPESAAQDGLLGSKKEKHLVRRRRFEATLDKALFGGKPGQLSGVVEGPANYYIVKVIRHFAAGVPPLEEIEEEVFARCYMERIRKVEEKVFRDSYKKVLLIDAKGRRVPLKTLWPTQRAPGGSLFET